MKKITGLMLALLLSSMLVDAQKITDTLSAKELKNYKEQSKELISFMQYLLNTLGDPATSTNDRDIIINQSYKKIFRDSTVQIEDDLDEDRDMPINKDVQAYLKDVVFFFKKAHFTFEVMEIKHFVNENNRLTFKVTANRNLKATTNKGEEVDNNKERYIEINLNKAEKQLKIASIYTHNINRKEDLRQWWMKLPFRWRKVLGEKYALTDSLDMSNVTNFTDTVVRYYLDTLDVAPSLVYRQLDKITKLTEINISGHTGITTLKGLTKLDELRKLNISGTSVQSLIPVRNLNNLEYLKAERTPLKSLDPIRYATKMKDLLLNNSLIADISAVENFPKLRRLHLNGTKIDSLQALSNATNLKDLRLAKTPVADLSPLSEAPALEYLDISQTNVSDLSPLKGLKNLERLDARNTTIEDVAPLEKAQSLKILILDNTGVSSLKSLTGLPELTKVYCDNTGVGKQEASAFIQKKPESIVVFNSRALRKWWDQLDFAWKKVFRRKLNFNDKPSKTDLHRISHIEKLDLAGNKKLRAIKPVARLNNLKTLDVSKTPVKDLSPLKDLLDLRKLNCSGTRVMDLTPLKGLNNLETLNCSNTSVKSLEPLAELQHLEILDVENTLVKNLQPLGNINSLQKVLADNAMVSAGTVKALLEKHPQCLVVFRTETLQKWWKGLNKAWKEVLGRYVKMDKPPTKEQLHKLTTLTEIEIVDNEQIRNLSPLDKFINLLTLHVNNTGIQSLKPVKDFEELQHLDIADNYQINKLNPVTALQHLKVLNFSNTAVEELDPVKKVKTLEEIYFAGTKISNLSPLESLKKLRIIDFSNTKVIFLKPIKGLNNLEKIKAYNTRVPGMFIKQFKKEQPACEVVYY